jgi:hypothetical protein
MRDDVLRACRIPTLWHLCNADLSDGERRMPHPHDVEHSTGSESSVHER